MFRSSLFLHKENLVSMSGASETSFQTGKVLQDIGSVDLSKTSLPMGISYDAVLAIVLDPLWKINDVDRSDNVFIQLVKVNGTDKTGAWVDQGVCRVEAVGLGEFTVLKLHITTVHGLAFLF